MWKSVALALVYGRHFNFIFCWASVEIDCKFSFLLLIYLIHILRRWNLITMTKFSYLSKIWNCQIHSLFLWTQVEVLHGLIHGIWSFSRFYFSFSRNKPLTVKIWGFGVKTSHLRSSSTIQAHLSGNLYALRSSSNVPMLSPFKLFRSHFLKLFLFFLKLD